MFNFLPVGLSIFLTALPSVSWGHGEDKLGPHKGYVRMPGAFHTELVVEGSKAYLYLLDFDWKNPTIENSGVSAKLHRGKARYEMKCTAAKNHFVCENSVVKAFEEKDVLEVEAERNGKKGIPVKYDWPLSLKMSH